VKDENCDPRAYPVAGRAPGDTTAEPPADVARHVCGAEGAARVRPISSVAGVRRGLLGLMTATGRIIADEVERTIDWVLQPWPVEGYLSRPADETAGSPRAGDVADAPLPRSCRAVLMNADGSGERTFDIVAGDGWLEAPPIEAAHTLLRHIVDVDSPWTARPAWQVTEACRHGGILLAQGVFGDERSRFLAFASPTDLFGASTGSTASRRC
jgi:hypothetical protein